MSITYQPWVNPQHLDARFRVLLEGFAKKVAAHRYGLAIIVTSGKREDSPHHRSGWGCDIRGRWPGWESAERKWKARLYLACVWAETLAEAGLESGSWGIGVYDDDDHIHLDVRRVPRGPKAAIWVETGGVRDGQ